MNQANEPVNDNVPFEAVIDYIAKVIYAGDGQIIQGKDMGFFGREGSPGDMERLGGKLKWCRAWTSSAQLRRQICSSDPSLDLTGWSVVLFIGTTDILWSGPEVGDIESQVDHIERVLDQYLDDVKAMLDFFGKVKVDTTFVVTPTPFKRHPLFKRAFQISKLMREDLMPLHNGHNVKVVDMHSSMLKRCGPKKCRNRKILAEFLGDSGYLLSIKGYLLLIGQAMLHDAYSFLIERLIAEAQLSNDCRMNWIVCEEWKKWLAENSGGERMNKWDIKKVESCLNHLKLLGDIVKGMREHGLTVTKNGKVMERSSLEGMMDMWEIEMKYAEEDIAEAEEL
jgi:hypothetical protein